MNWKKTESDWVFPTVDAGTDVIDIKTVPTQQVPLSSVLKLTSNDTREVICGWGAALINVAITYPINKIIFRQILEGVPVGTAVHQLSNEGLKFLYRGILPPLCQKTLSLSIMFSVYEGSRERLYILTRRKVFAKVVAANVAGVAEALLMPFERVQTLLQDWHYHEKFRNTSHAFRYLLVNYGVSECYRGFLPIIYRNGLSNLMFFTLRDQSKVLLGNEETLVKNFISGAVIGGFISTVFYPMNVIKIHMQSKIGGSFEKLFAVIREVYISRNKSVVSFYKGVHLNYLRSFVSWGVINASYDLLKHVVF